jgi:RimJ/RimL family protein N-acetyltransferase
MLAIWNDPAFMQNVGDRCIRDLDQARQAIEDNILSLYTQYGYGPYRLQGLADRSHLGICGLFKRPNLDEPDIGFALLPAYCRQGYASEAATAVLEHAQGPLALASVSAIVNPLNRPSIQLLEQLGFSHAGRYQLPGSEQALLHYRICFSENP